MKLMSGAMLWLAAMSAMIALLIGCSKSIDSASKVDRKAMPRGGNDGRPVDIVGASSGAIRFVDRVATSGIDFAYLNGEEAGEFSILESMGGGVGLFDFDLDGALDVFVPGGGGFGANAVPHGRPPGFFRNSGNWKFESVVELARLNRANHYTHGVAAADFDADGFPDVLVTGFGGLLCFHNAGDGTFDEVAVQAGLTDTAWSTSAAWGDVNGDGWLDLYVAHYVDWSPSNHPTCNDSPTQRDVCPPRRFHGLPDTLYLGNGDSTFRDASAEAGLKADGKGIGVVVGDIDVDGDLDIYVANDTVSNFLYVNDGRGHFTENGLVSGTALNEQGLPDGSMGTDLGDFNSDGLPDIWVANYERESCALYRNQGSGLFRHVSQPMGITAVGGTYVGWGTMFLDADRDGDEDLFVSNGHVIHFPHGSTVRQLPILFENLDGQRMQDVAAQAGDYMQTQHRGRGAACGDLDGDGDLDLVISHVNERVALLSNESPNEGGWIGLRLVGRQASRQAIGTIVRAKVGNRTIVRQWKGGTSYASTMSEELFFGLGGATQLDRLEVRWSTGEIQVFDSLPAKSRWRVIQGGDLSSILSF